MKPVDASWDMEKAGSVPRKPWWKRPLGIVVIGILGVIALYRIALLFLIGDFTVPTSSMENTILAGDRVWVSRSSDPPRRGEIVAFAFPGMREEIAPRDKQYYIDRVVAVGGDTVEVRDNQVYINGVSQKAAPGVKLGGVGEGSDDQSHTFPSGYGFSQRAWGPLRVPKKGDRIDLSDQSRRFAWEVFVRRDLLASDPELDPKKLAYEDLPASHTVRGDYYFVLGDNRNNAMDSRFWGFVPVTATYGRPFMIYMSTDPDGGFRSDRMFKSIEE